jgi:hypothetical protein
VGVRAHARARVCVFVYVASHNHRRSASAHQRNIKTAHGGVLLRAAFAHDTHLTHICIAHDTHLTLLQGVLELDYSSFKRPSGKIEELSDERADAIQVDACGA